jgi:four helix bundle protein
LKKIDEYTLPFEKLKTWHVVKDFAKRVYEVTKQFPAIEQYGLTSQIRRAAVSVMSNIAEGSARTSRKDQAHFSQLTYSSLMEVACQLQLSHEMGFLESEVYEELRRYVVELSNVSTFHQFNVFQGLL